MTEPPMLLFQAYKRVLVRNHAGKHDTKVRSRRRGKNKYPGIVEAARALKVNRSHIYRVLEGERRSPRIEAYFAKVKKLTGGGR